MAMIFVNVAMFLAVPECRSARSRRERPQRRGHERDALAHGQEFLDVLESQD